MFSKDIEIEIGTIIRIYCHDIDNKGNGISRLNKNIFITPNLLPEEEAEVKVEYKKGGFWITSIVTRLSNSNFRCIPKCNHFERCGSCSLQHINNDNELLWKVKNLKQVLKRIGNIDNSIQPLLNPNSKDYSYRNRAIIPIKFDDKFNLRFGYYERGTNKIVNINQCPVLDHKLERIIPSLRSEIIKFSMIDKLTKKSLQQLKNVAIRYSKKTDEMLIIFVSSKNNYKQIKQLSKIIFDKYEFIKGITFNIQPIGNNVIFGKKTILLEGRDYINDRFLDLKFRHSSTTFFQLNSVQAEKITSFIVNWAKTENKINRIVDSFCGIGTISLPLTKVCDEVIGIEFNQESINLARQNAALNKIMNVQFIQGDIESTLGKILNNTDILILDPPRKGLTDKVVTVILAKRPTKIAYLSCHSATLARDLNLLTKNNYYKIQLIQPIDFFPQTTHLECLVFLNRTNYVTLR